MTKILLKMVMVSFFLFAVGVVYGGSGELISYYGECIDQKIVQCERNAAFRDSESESLRQWAYVNQLKAEYYKRNKEEIIRKMVAQGLGQKQCKIDYFLNKSFTNHYDRASHETKISE